MEQTPRHSVSAAGVIFDPSGTQVLLIQRRDNDTWEPPGGVLELDETVEEGLSREIREETGVEIEVEELSGVYKNMSRGIIAFVFRCVPLTNPLTSTPEASRIAWVPVDDVDRMMTTAYAIRVMDATQRGIVQFRSHDGVRLLDAAHGRERGAVPRGPTPARHPTADLRQFLLPDALSSAVIRRQLCDASSSRDLMRHAWTPIRQHQRAPSPA